MYNKIHRTAMQRPGVYHQSCAGKNKCRNEPEDSEVCEKVKNCKYKKGAGKYSLRLSISGQ
jgi:hypothetical protein